MPNVTRAVIGRSDGSTTDRVVCLETNLDDFVPEHFDHLMERLLDAGALDVSIQHQQMKKNRPGFLVRVLAKPSDRVAMARILFADSTAIGVRATESDRILLRRRGQGELLSCSVPIMNNMPAVLYETVSSLFLIPILRASAARNQR